MSLIGRLSHRETSTLAKPTEWLSAMFGGASKSGANVTQKTALEHSTVYACVKIVSESMASLPLSVYRNMTKNGKTYKEKALDHPLHFLLHDEPNDDMTSFTWIQVVLIVLLLRGNHYSQIVRSQAGRIIGIYPLDADRMTVVRLSSGKIGYIYRSESYGEVPLSAEEVLHFIGMSLDGIIGMSAITYNRNTIGMGITLEEFGGTLFKNGAYPSGVVTGEGVREMSDLAFKRFKDSFNEQYHGADNVGKTILLEDGFKFTPITISNKDGQYLESRKFTKAEIAAMFGVPLHKINELDKATFSNIEQQSLEFVIDAIRPWAVRMEKEMKRKLFTPAEKKTYFVRFNLGALLRGDTESRYKAYESAITKGCWMTRNEARELEDLNPIEGLDDIIVPLNFTKEGQQNANQG
ncbi:phage portal protein [Sulfurimonas sp. HSL1-6]|uniref:phage portal protein n=1 Tax=Thiomicrolovo immobilis TaxID=3131935 RepID=UPI0031F952A3